MAVFAQHRSGLKTSLQHKFVTLHKRKCSKRQINTGQSGKANNSAVCDAQIILNQQSRVCLFFKFFVPLPPSFFLNFF